MHCVYDWKRTSARWLGAMCCVLRKRRGIDVGELTAVLDGLKWIAPVCHYCGAHVAPNMRAAMQHALECPVFPEDGAEAAAACLEYEARMRGFDA